MGGCSRGNPETIALSGILRNHQDAILAIFGSFLDCQLILYAELMAGYEGLELAI